MRRSRIRSCEWVGGSAGLFSLPLTGDDFGAGEIVEISGEAETAIKHSLREGDR